MYGRGFFAGIGLTVLAATASRGDCVRPDPPSCALERVPFASGMAFDNCRKEMLRFRDEMDGYASCLGEASADQEKAARDDYENVRIRFNERARAEFDQLRK